MKVIILIFVLFFGFSAFAQDVDMILVKGGTFMMGCGDNHKDFCELNEDTAHLVHVSDFYIGKYEVTLGEFRQFVEATNYITEAEQVNFSHAEKDSAVSYLFWRCDASGSIRGPRENDNPVIYISWNDANRYCDWLSKEHNRRYRLPTEAEWEYAARGGACRKYNEKQAKVRPCNDFNFSGSNIIEDVAWYVKNSYGGTCNKGTRDSNELGIFDMSGNVQEWCSDYYEVCYSSEPLVNPQGPKSGILRVVRGGAWDKTENECRVSSRNAKQESYSSYNLGFRIVLEP